MLPLLERYGVQVVALSKDDLDECRRHRAQDGLTLTLLSDPAFRVIDAFGLRHRAGGEMKTFTVAGIPLGYPVGFRDQAIPTTLLVDEHGVIRWIDQADDYRLRGDEARIRHALKQAFGELT